MPAATPRALQLDVGAVTAVKRPPVEERAERERPARRHEVLQLVPGPPVPAGRDLHLPKNVERIGRRVEPALEIHFEPVPILPLAPEKPPLEPCGLPVGRANERSGPVGNDVPFGDELEVELADAESVRSRHEVRVARGLPDAGAPHEAKWRGEPIVDPV